MMLTRLSMSQLGRCQRKEGAGVDAEPVSVVVAVVWASCSRMMLGEGSGDVRGERAPTRARKWTLSSKVLR